MIHSSLSWGNFHRIIVTIESIVEYMLYKASMLGFSRYKLSFGSFFFLVMLLKHGSIVEVLRYQSERADTILKNTFCFVLVSFFFFGIKV